MKSLFSLTRLLRGCVLLSAVVGGLVTTAAAAPGEVFSQKKIAEGVGGLASETLADFDLFGTSCTSLGDLDGDGIPELVVGARFDSTGGFRQGAVYVLFLNANGSVKSMTKIADGVGGLAGGTLQEDNAQFGTSCTALGDLDGDGIRDLAVAAQNDDTGAINRGAVYVLFLNANGTVKSHAKIGDGVGGLAVDTLSGDGALFGSSCAVLGDLNGDGIFDLGVAEPGDNKGALHVLFLNANGTVKARTKIADGEGGLGGGTLSNGDMFGRRGMTVIGDLDGDGFPELAVGATDDDTGADLAGAVYVLFLKGDGTVRAYQKIANGVGGLPGSTIKEFHSFGTSCTAPGDLNGDGNPDLVVGASDELDDDNGVGAVYILFLDSDGTVESHTKIASNTGGLGVLPGFEDFGNSCAFLGDLDSDGVVELAVGAPDEDTGGIRRGAVYILSLGDPPLRVDTGLDEFDTPSTNGSGAVSLREAIRDAKATGEFRNITFESFLVGSPLPLTRGPLEITDQSVAIRGPGSPLTISGADTTKVFELSDSAVVTLECLEIANGLNAGTGGGISVSSTSQLVAKDVEFRDCVSSANAGGAIGSGGKVTLERCSFVGNQAEAGGAIFNFLATGILRVTNSTFSGNVATEATDGGTGDAGGGAIFNLASATASIRHTTFAENEATLGAGGAILVESGTVEVENSLYAGNTAVTGQNDSGPISLTLVPEIPLTDLESLGDFGGKTPTRPLKAGSSAINGGFYLPLPTTDQRGEARRDGMPDLGAVEFVPPPVVDNSAAKRKLSKKIRKLKKKQKNARRKKQVAKLKRFKKKIRNLTKQLRRL